MKDEEWLKGDDRELEYHLKQYDNPKLYTIELLNYFKEWNLINDGDNILDIGSGCGANINYFASFFKNSNFFGIDLNSNYVDIANNRKKENTKFYNYNACDKIKMDVNYDGVICLQTLSWICFKDYQKIIKNIMDINPKWFLITSLFYDGKVDAKIEIKDYSRITQDKNYRKSYYNIYSLDKLKTFLKNKYYIDRFIPFELKVDLKKNDNGMGTYTEKLENGKKLQISGPLLMPWYTILIRKK